MQKPTRMFCQICGKVHKIDFWVPNEIWEEAIHPRFRDTHVCINCFTERADEKLLFWDTEIKYYSTSLASQIEIQNGVIGKFYKCPVCDEVGGDHKFNCDLNKS